MPRKTARALAGSAPGVEASMRPRPDAAENRGRGLRPGCRRRASMRPRPDAAENLTSAVGSIGRQTDRFNEAAARCRGKPWATQVMILPAWVASMRPRPDAAENLTTAACSQRQPLASMRPRPDAAENPGGDAHPIGRRPRASMRPRPDAAENPISTVSALTLLRDASMRPRPDAAENPARAGGRRRTPAPRPGFNEAAARCRGKPMICTEDGYIALAASMRPRPDAAENRPAWSRCCGWCRALLQ